MLDDTLKAQLQQYLALLRQPIRLIASLDDSETGVDMKNLLETIVGLSDKVTPGHHRVTTYASPLLWWPEKARPLGCDLQACRWATSSHRWCWRCSGPVVIPPKVEQDVIDSIKALEGNFNFEVYMSPQLPQLPRRGAGAVAHGHRQPECEDRGHRRRRLPGRSRRARQIMAVPMVFLNGQVFGSGRMSVEEIVAKLDTNAGERDAAKLSAKDPFDVLGRGRWPCRCGRCRVRGPQRHPRGCGGRAFWRPDQRHHGHRELHLGARDRRSQVRGGSGSTSAPLRGGHHELAACRQDHSQPASLAG